jgi:hypothetical protein
MASFEEAYQNYEKSNRGKTVSGMYDAQRDSELASLKSTYEQNLSNRQAARDQIGTTYQGQANDLAAQYERNRRNLNTQAAANGISTGAGSQQALALSGQYQRDYGALRGREAQDIAEADRGIADLKVAYQNAVQQANAQGDYKRMAALLADYDTQRQNALNDANLLAKYGDFSGYSGIMSDDQINAMRAEYDRLRGIEDEDRAYAREQDALNNNLKQAQLRAGYGDFSGFAKLGYSQETINAMRSLWIAQNPLLAYNTGAITADEYYKMTGLQAPGVTAPAAAGGGGGGRDLTWVPQSNTNNLTDKSGGGKSKAATGTRNKTTTQVDRASGVNASSYNLNTQKGIDDYAKALVANGDLNMRQATAIRDQLSHSSGSGTSSTKTAATRSTVRGGSNARARDVK